MNVEQEVARILHSVLNVDPKTTAWTSETQLLGSIAELDSMAVVSILTAIEEHFGFVVDDDEVEGRTFSTVGSLTRFVSAKLDQ